MATEDSCAVSQALTESVVFALSVAIISVSALLSLVLNTGIIIALKNVARLDLNAQYLLINLSVGCILCSLNVAAYAAHTIWNGYVTTDPCALQMSLVSCVEANLLAVAGMNAVLFSLMGIGLERCYATKFAHTYADRKPNRMVGALLVLLVWLLSTISPALYVTAAASQPANGTRPMHYCSILLARSRQKTIPAVTVYVLCEMVAVASYLTVLVINRKVVRKWLLSRAHYSLAWRVQLRRNIETTEMMLTTVCVHAVCLFPVIFAIPLVRFHLDMSEEMRIICSMPIYSLILIHFVVHPLACYASFEPLRMEVKKILAGNKVSNAPNGGRRTVNSAVAIVLDQKNENLQAEERLNDHFDFLDKQWNVKKR